MNYRENILLLRAGSSNIAVVAPSYTVTAYPVGAVASANSSGGTLTVDAGHGFAAGDKLLIDPGGDNTFSGSNTVSSVTATSIVMGGGSYAVTSGDKIVNLGPDTSTGSTPNYDGSPMAIYSDADGSSAITNARVTASSAGEYAYYHRGDGRFWELVRDAGGTVRDCIAGFGGVAGRWNVMDYGANPAASNNAPRIQRTMDVVVGNGGGGEVYGPKGVSLTITTAVTFGTSTAQAFRDAKLTDINLKVSGITALILREAQDVRIEDIDIDGQESASSKGIQFRNSQFCWVQRCTVRDCQTAIQLASDTGTSQNTLNIVDNHLYIGQLSSDTGGIASSIGIDVDTTDNFLQQNRIYGFVKGITIDATSNLIQENHIYKGYPTSNVLQYCLDITSNNSVVRGNYLDNASVHHIRLTDPFTESITGNYFLCGTSNLVPCISFEYSSNAYFSQITIEHNHFSYLASYSDEVIDLGPGTEYQHANTAGAYIQHNTFQGYSGTHQIQGNTGADNLGDTFIAPQTTTALRVISGATPNVKGATIVTTSNGGATTVTALNGGLPGQVLTILIGDANTSFQHSSSLKLRGGGDWTNAGSADSITFAHDGTNWREVSRTPQSAALSDGVTNVSVTGNDAIATFGRYYINLTNTSGTNTITLNAPSSTDNGKRLVLRCAAITAGSLTLADSGNCDLSTALGSWVPTAGDTLYLIAQGTVWYELTRSTN